MGKITHLFNAVGQAYLRGMKWILSTFLFLFSFVLSAEQKYVGMVYPPGDFTVTGMFSKNSGSTLGHLTTNFRNGEVVIFDIEGMDKNLELSGIRKMRVKIEERQDTRELKKKMWLPGAVRVKAYFVDIGEPYKPPFNLVHPSRMPSTD